MRNRGQNLHDISPGGGDRQQAVIPFQGAALLVLLYSASLGCAEELVPMQPVLFEPGTLSTELPERDLSFTPDGHRLFTTLWTGQAGILLESRRGDAGWKSPRRLPFSGTFSDLEPFVTPDGRWLWFSSNRPRPGVETGARDYNLWRVPIIDAGWGEPEPLPGTLCGPGDEFYPTLSREGLLIFTAERTGGMGGEDLWFSRETVTGWQEPWNAGPAVNSPLGEFNALLAPDGRTLWFSSAGRAGEIGGGDLYETRLDSLQAWTPARLLPEPINSKALDYCPALDPAGNFYFSSRRRLAVMTQPAPWSRDSLARPLREPGNGSGDLFMLPLGARPLP